MARSVRRERFELAASLRAEGRTWVYVADSLRQRWPELTPRAALRLAHSWTQGDVVDAWQQCWPAERPPERKEVSRWEVWPSRSGARPSLDTLRKLARLYECAVSDLLSDFGDYRHRDVANHPRLPAHQKHPTVEVNRAEPPVDRREFLAGSAAFTLAASLPTPSPSRVAAADMEVFRDAARALYALDDRYGGRVARAHAARYLGDLHHTLKTASYGPVVGRDLQLLCGQVTEMAGWLAFDSGDHDAARRHFTEALMIAHVTDSNQLATLASTSMSFQASTSNAGREAIDLAEAAQRSARPYATARLLSLLTAREGLAHARAGNKTRAYELLLRSEQLLDDADTSADDEDWLAFWGPADLAWTTSLAHRTLGMHTEAVTAGRVALAHVGSDYLRNQGIYRSGLARSLAVCEDIDEAASIAMRALDSSTKVECGRLDDDLRGLRSHLAPHAAVPTVGEFLNRSDHLIKA